MAVVITTDETSSYFSPGPLRRSHSQSHFASSAPTPSTSASSVFPSASHSSASSCTNLQALYRESTAATAAQPYSRSSSTTSSPRLAATSSVSSNPSAASTPASNFSLLSYDDDDDDDDDGGGGGGGGADAGRYNPYYSGGGGGGGLIRNSSSSGISNTKPPPQTSTSFSSPLLRPPVSSPTDASPTSEPDLVTDDVDADADQDQDQDGADIDIDDTPKPDTPEVPEHAEDDSAVSTRPSRQVDYLSHEWREEDIWASWRYIINRRGEYANSARLENASWRTWMKSKNKLSTVSPETLNWLKDCDVTWLYGPLQPATNGADPTRSGNGSSSVSKSGSSSNLQKKPILKKRSTSEVMLQRSLSTASLLKQAAAAVQAQETTKGILRPSFVRSSTDYATYPFTSRRMSQGNLHSSMYTSTAGSSSVASPSVERRHIHFNEQVFQCIAVDVKGDDDNGGGGNGNGNESAVCDDNDSDSDDGIVMMRSRSRKKVPVPNRRPRHKTPSGATSPREAVTSKTIAMLPSTTLKYREDTPERADSAMKHSTVRSPMGSPTSSQETLRPSMSRSRFVLGDEDDDEDDEGDGKEGEADIMDGFCHPDDDDDDAWRPQQHDGITSPRSSSGSSSSISHAGTLTGEDGHSPASGSDDGGMKRTASGMLMPYSEADSTQRDGVFSRVIDTVNTARDIAHVIWNVGWRK
ncbi:Fungal protein of unknown function (DUF1752) [Geosmithia morbida]|uniref:Nitrogen regulatory protein areA GATA-like domain-containing protein n=1 Tax=Geosmithia morbida TaxID=1094350 RepID=A0A9P4YT45_9HYPO|nr:Fungal protein of unknown function (DUF1752) [Geosmithia morbida]KAF4122631.1 Fungal protein of unknown function (DUF1752) [Geosmithia morbida]